ncbi:MAG: DUF4261 domain-containing protein [Alphaproteobacteria bacterium]|nr:DUF4261 domain-containing protein [Alphaproteobacteria bacterium]MCB9697649.1 DUF4261 domain-containing protein [Alphaproteobacteria bacterium]
MPLIAFVTLPPDARAPSREELHAAWARLWPRDPPPAELDVIAHIPAPVPWSDLEGPTGCAWHWPQAAEVVRAHASHLIVAVADADPDVKSAVQLTRLVAAAIEACPAATAVYWGAGTTVSPADRFLATARDMTPDELPLLSWIEFRVFGDDGATSLFTTGLAPLGLMEIEIRASKRDAEHLIERAYDFAHYQALRGRVLRHGDTIGASADERIAIRHAPSAWDRPGQVLTLDL